MIRPLEEKDLSFIASVKDIDFSDGWDIRMLKSALKTDNFYGFVLEDSQPFAFITYLVAYDAVDILDVYVSKAQRRKGYAEKLIDTVEDDVKLKNAKQILLEVKEDNLPAINLYQKKGYSKISERKKYYADGKTALIMLKEI